MKLIVKCQCCGREVEAKNPKKKYCSPLCAKQAQAAGLSYGQYVARMYGKRG